MPIIPPKSGERRNPKGRPKGSVKLRDLAELRRGLAQLTETIAANRAQSEAIMQLLEIVSAQDQRINALEKLLGLRASAQAEGEMGEQTYEPEIQF